MAPQTGLRVPELTPPHWCRQGGGVPLSALFPALSRNARTLYGDRQGRGAWGGGWNAARGVSPTSQGGLQPASWARSAGLGSVTTRGVGGPERGGSSAQGFPGATGVGPFVL